MGAERRFPAVSREARFEQFEDAAGLGEALARASGERVWAGLPPDVDVAQVAELLADNHPALKGLNLTSVRLSHHDVAPIAEALEQNDQLEELWLRSCKLGPSGAQILAESLTKNKGLKLLNLYNNGFGDAGGEAVADIIRGGAPIEVLDLGNNAIGKRGGVALAQAIGSSKTMRNINLWNNGVGDEGAGEFAKVIASPDSKLQALNLFFNNIYLEAIIKIAEALEKNTALVSLNLGRNRLGDAGAEVLARALEKNSANKITELKLSLCDIWDDGAKAIFRAISQDSSKVELLHISRNRITAKSAKSIAGALKKSKLHTLHLLKNKLDRGLEKIVSVLQARPNLEIRELLLNDNMGKLEKVAGESEEPPPPKDLCEPEDKARIGTLFVEALKKQHNLVKIDVRNNGFGEDCENLVEELIKVDFSDGNAAGKRTAAIFKAVFVNSDLFENDVPTLEDIDEGEAREEEERRTRSKSVASAPADNKENYLSRFKLRWTDGAFRLARDNLMLFVQCLETVLTELHRRIKKANGDHEPAKPILQWIWSSTELWLAKLPNTEQPFIHEIFGSKDKAGLARLHNFLDHPETVKVDTMMTLLNSPDHENRTLRRIAFSSDVNGWAAAYGTYLSRFQIDMAPPVHVSDTCVVCFATDVTNEDAKVALKIMRREEDFERELRSRSVEFKKPMNPNAVESVTGQLEIGNMLPILAVHKKAKCIIMDRADRSLFEAMHTESIAGHNINRIQVVAFDICKVLLKLHSDGHKLIHGDIKPRNVMRTSKQSSSDYFIFEETTSDLQMQSNREKFTSRTFHNKNWEEMMTSRAMHTRKQSARDLQDTPETWAVIDMDASVNFDEELSNKSSSGYAPPEMAKCLYTGTERPKAHPAYDSWSFGAVLFELLSGTPLFLMDKSNDDLVSAYDKSELMNWLVLDEDRLNRIEFPENEIAAHLIKVTQSLLPAAKDLVKRCLVGDPAKRLTMEQIYNHEFFDSLRNTLENRRASHGRPRQKSTGSPRHLRSVPEAEPAMGSRHLLESDDSNRRSSSKSGETRVKFSQTEQRKGSGKFFACLTGRRSVERKSIRSVDPADPPVAPDPSDLSLDSRKRHRSGLNGSGFEDLLHFHFFFSHVQKEASGIVKDLYLNCRENRCIGWLDVLADDLTTSGMEQGVAKSQVFIFVLTKSILFRPFCIRELIWAIQNNKKVICVVEVDDRFSEFNEHLLPWYTEQEVRTNLKQANFKPKAIEKMIKEFSSSMDYLKSQLGNDFKDFIDEISSSWDVFERVPYRRRAYESEAMIDHILGLANLTSPARVREFEALRAAEARSASPAAPVKSDKPKRPAPLVHSVSLKEVRSKVEREVLVVYGSGSRAGKTIADEIVSTINGDAKELQLNHELVTFNALPDEGGAELESRIKARRSKGLFVMVVLTNGCLSGPSSLTGVLEKWWISAHNNVCCIHEKWDFDSAEHKELQTNHKNLFAKLFMDTEILQVRRLSDLKYEHLALVRELQRRLVAVTTSG